ncbi:hypothetical protein H1R20_g13672, partial [Candolleomyces eurysporus]
MFSLSPCVAVYEPPILALTGHPQDVPCPSPHQSIPATPVDNTIDWIGCKAGKREGEDDENEDKDEDKDEDNESKIEASPKRLQTLSLKNLAHRHSFSSSMYTNPPNRGSLCQPLQAFPMEDNVEGKYNNIR